MWKILFQDFLGDLATQKTRAFLTIFAVGWGTLAIILLLAFGEGLRYGIVSGELGAGEQLFIVYPGRTTRVFEGLPTGRAVSLVESDLELLRTSIPDLEMGSVSHGKNGTVLRSPFLQTTTMMEGVDPGFSVMRNMYPAAGGRFLNEQDVLERRRVAFLGDSIARRLFPGTDPVGQTLFVDGVPFVVVGTMVTKVQTSMNNGPDADRVIIPSTTMATIYGRTNVSSLLVRPRDTTRAPFVKRRIQEVLGSRYQFDPDDENALPIRDFIENLKTTQLIAGGIQIFLGIVGALTLIVAGVGLANVMYVVVRERTREIGIRRALGARRHHIIAQFVGEAMLLAMTGGLAGLALAATLVVGVASLPDANEAMTFIANPRLSWPIGLGTVAILTVIGIVAGLLPARRAAAVDPVEALRYE
jgi:putative ABC transport system permease protein